ncbi:hypothetical protein PENTCL1PPCAC_15840, partial [Pristionchus entomophagus]
LVIRCYYFPIASSIRVATKQIRGIYYRNQDVIPTIGDTKAWGMSFSPCWRACIWRRKWRVNALDDNAQRRGTAYYNVVIDNESMHLKGFTTGNLRPLLKNLRTQCAPGVVCKECFP